MSAGDVLVPRRDVLPAAQQSLWQQMGRAASLGLVLYGGTAIAVRLGHRPSVDFDFFTSDDLDRDVLLAAFPFLREGTVLQERPNTLTVLSSAVGEAASHVQVSFFGGIGFGRVGRPDLTDDGHLLVASLDDLMATKLKVLLQRVESKDYRDVDAMIRAGVSLARGLASARALFGPSFQPSECLKALTWFQGGDLEVLAPQTRAALVAAAGAVRDLPEVSIVSRRLCP